MAVVYQRGFIADLDGLPLDGLLYIGTADLDPETNPIQAYWDSAFTIPATQPITISAGYVTNIGTRAAIYVNASSYSYRARNAASVQVDYIANSAQSGVTSIGISGGTTGLTVSGSPVTGSGTITLGGTLSVANGGTGGTTAAAARSGISAAASGANSDITALSDGVTLTSGGTLSAATLGPRGFTQNGITANYTLALPDFAKEIYITGTTAAQTVTIPASGSVNFPTGAWVTITNDSNQSWSIAITTDTLVWSPNNTTGTRTLAPGGQATVRKVAGSRWWIAGGGLT